MLGNIYSGRGLVTVVLWEKLLTAPLESSTDVKYTMFAFVHKMQEKSKPKV